jgi:hypothetical protein
MDYIVFPPFNELPAVPAQPQGCLWNFFDKDGKKDELGSKLVSHLDTLLAAHDLIIFSAQSSNAICCA